MADRIHIITPEDYHHNGYFLLEAQGIADGERLHQWIRGFGWKTAFNICHQIALNFPVKKFHVQYYQHDGG